MAIVGTAVMAPTYAGLIVEGPGYSRRGGALPRSDAVESNALGPGRLATLINPRLALADMNDRTDISMRSVYVGWLVPVLEGVYTEWLGDQGGDPGFTARLVGQRRVTGAPFTFHVLGHQTQDLLTFVHWWAFWGRAEYYLSPQQGV